MSVHTFTCESEADTRALAARLAAILVPPCLVLLNGGLGAGKTTFVRGFVRALDPAARVKSPTYALAHSYPTNPVVHHMDLYRTGDPEDALELGLLHLIDDAEAFCLIEWPRNLGAVLDTDAPLLDITLTEPGQPRRVTMRSEVDVISSALKSL